MIQKKQLIGFELSAQGTETFHSINATNGEQTADTFYKATQDEINHAVAKADSAFQIYRKKTAAERASFLEAIGEEIIALGDELITTACNETALAKPRIEGERMRTVNQLKMFAALIKEGSWIDARIETAIPDRAPIPKCDLRYMQIALGPVAVFGASNFPLAFSVAGGDTASALAAGCSVVVKAHPAHPATSWLVGNAVQAAAKKTNMPDGILSVLFDNGIDVGSQLVKQPQIKAVGFTGSLKGGKALFDIAMSREVPIPVYAEMGSTNPIFILPEALQTKMDKIAAGYASSVTLGVGQFCTNPGLLVYEQSSVAESFTQHLKDEFTKTNGGTMLASNIFQSYNKGVSQYTATAGVELLATGTAENSNTAQPALFKTTASLFSQQSHLAEEVFGPTSIAVQADSKTEVIALAKNLTGHLTATVHGTDNDLENYKDLLYILEQKAGRVIINGFPTGVEVCNAMVHGGPFPATTDARSTSVGTAAIYRFTRPVCYQDMPQQILPIELKNDNELNIWRMINGERTKDNI